MNRRPAGSRSPEIAVATLYKENLVTRHTGRAVRMSIEGMAAEGKGQSLTVLDFADVSVIDFSCADEIVAKLMLRAQPRSSSDRETFLLIRGLSSQHIDPVETALCRRGLAVAAERTSGEPVLIGAVDPAAQRAWEAVCQEGRTCPGALAARLGMDADACGRILDAMHTRRLIRREGDEYHSLSATYAEALRAGLAVRPADRADAGAPHGG